MLTWSSEFHVSLKTWWFHDFLYYLRTCLTWRTLVYTCVNVFFRILLKWSPWDYERTPEKILILFLRPTIIAWWDVSVSYFYCFVKTTILNLKSIGDMSIHYSHLDFSSYHCLCPCTFQCTYRVGEWLRSTLVLDCWIGHLIPPCTVLSALLSYCVHARS